MTEEDQPRKRPARSRKRTTPKPKPKAKPEGELETEPEPIAEVPDEPEEETASDGKEEGGSPARRRRRRRKPSGSTTGAQRRMLISVGQDRHQIAVLESDELVEHYVAHKDDPSIVGNIYVGKVKNVLPGMEAAFVDVGVERNAVLYAGEVDFDEELEGDAPRIEQMLKTGQRIMAQVTKDPMRHKGARLTNRVSIPGRYVVLVPDSEFIGISRRLPEDQRRRLKDLAARVRPPGFGLIVRTAAEDADEDELDRDVVKLVETWYDISAKAKRGKAPKLIYSEPELVIRVARDLLNKDVKSVLVDDQDVHAQLVSYISEVTPELAKLIEHYTESLPLFERFHVVEQIRKALDRKVWLKSGGHIVIERTEAMTVIDVNTGRFVGKSNLEETVLKNNLEAADEIAKQLRLRDIGGIIVIDFIDMIHERNREELVRTFKAALARDKTRTQVYSISELGLLQMTRKNVSEGLLEAFSEACDRCGGWGVVLTDIE